jgi:UDP-glucose 4-epimerase
MTKVFISGVAGFIGSNLAKKMLQNNYMVLGVDNLNYGNINNIKDLIPNSNFEFIEGDILEAHHYFHKSVDIVVHLASQKIPRYTNSLRTLEENDAMTKKMIDFALKNNARLIFASTSDIYGKNPKVPFSEKSDIVLGQTTVKRWAYATSKMVSEHKIIAYSDAKGLKFTIVRFFGSYGANQNLTWWGGPQSVFIDKAIKNEEIELHGDGLQTRTFTFIDDTVEALKLCIEKEEAENEIFNIASNPKEEISIKDLAFLIWDLVRNESSPKIKFIPYKTFGNYEDVRRRVPNIDKIKKLGFQPKYSLIEGLKKTIEWQKQYYLEK